MQDIEAELRREEAVRALLPVFFASGATGLVYQTLWARELHLVFGTSSFAISTVLSAFMAGLAVGGFVAARRADTVRNPLVVYGVLEIGIGVYSALFPYLVDGLEPVYLWAWRAFEPPPVLFGTIQAVLVGSALVIPTSLMGATLPLLARFATDRVGAAGDRVGTLYGVNTAGAVFGTWFCGFVLLPAIGLSLTTWLTAGANIALGCVALWIASRAKGAEQVPVRGDDVVVADPDRLMLRVSVAAALAGFSSLVYEVAWTRLLVLMLGASVYAFSTMLLAFLVGIAAGGKIGGRVADWILEKWGQAGVVIGLAVVEIGVGLLSWGLAWIFQELPFWYTWLFDGFGAEKHPTAMWVVSTMIAAVIMTPPAVLMGIAFPMAVRAVVGDAHKLGAPVGSIYSANTAGSLVGAALAGFLLLPRIGVQSTVFIGIAVNLLAAVWLVMRPAGGTTLRQRLSVIGAAVVLAPLLTGNVLRPPWNPLLMTAGMYKYVTETEDHSREGIYKYAVERYKLLYYEEGLSSVVTVAQNPRTMNIWLANNGKVDASTSTDMPTQVLVSLLPFQFVEDPKDVVVIGLASGITAGSVSTVDDVDHLEIVELEPAIYRAARFFDAHNHQVLDDPRTKLVWNDGRNHILLAPEHSYDVIVSEPSNPWISGVSNLFTREFLEMGKTKLKPGGVWSQWVQMYGMGKEDLRSLLATFADVYPYVLLYATIEDADLVIVGSESPIHPDPKLADRLLQRWPKAAEELRRIKMESGADLTSTWVMDRNGILAMTEGAQLNTDDNMKIEYGAPLHLHEATSVTNMELLVQHAEVPVLEVMDSDPVRLGELARSYIERDDFDRAMIAMSHAISLAAAPDPEAVAHATKATELCAGGLDQRAETEGALGEMKEVVRLGEERAFLTPEFLDVWYGWREDLVKWAQEDDEEE